jgi:hypothetical protein
MSTATTSHLRLARARCDQADEFIFTAQSFSQPGTALKPHLFEGPGPTLSALKQLRQVPLALDRQIGATDTQIDRLVYDLYGLTEDEIKIVEGAA